MQMKRHAALTTRTASVPPAALVLVVLLAGCGGGSGTASGSSPSTSSPSAGGAAPAAAGGGTSTAGTAPDPCSLVTAQALSAAYGVTFGQGTPSTEDTAAKRGFRACKWSDAAGTKSFVLQAVASGGKLGESAAELYDQSKDLYSGSTAGGSGDESLLLPEGAGFLAVANDVFLQGNAIIFGAKTPPGASSTVLKVVVAAVH